MATKERALELIEELQKLIRGTKAFSYKDLTFHLEEARKVFPGNFSKEQEAKQQEKADTSVPESSTDAHVWTDGACSGNPGKGGWGGIIEYNNERKEISGYQEQTTNNQMEMTAVIRALQALPKQITVTVTTDSQYVVNGMKSWVKGWKAKNWKKADGKPVLNKELWLELELEAKQRSITWHWVKGHAGHDKNERCDELARKAIQNNQ